MSPEFQNLPYLSLNNYFKSKYNHRVQKITVTIPVTCPNKDGTKGRGGCTYCHEGSIPPGNSPDIPLARQVGAGIERGKKRYGSPAKFLVYFQTNTNTYGPPGMLKKLYDEALGFDGVIGLDIGTRPDCADVEILSVLETYTENFPEIWIEYGLQSASEETLKKINRGHGVEDFLNAVKRTKNTGIKIIAHVIIGFPWETKQDYLETVKTAVAAGIDGIKIHPLYIMDGTQMGKEYRKEKFKLLSLEEYVKILADIIEIIPENVVIMRFTAEGDEKKLLAPDYCRPAYKPKIKQMLIDELDKRNSFQGKKLK